MSGHIPWFVVGLLIAATVYLFMARRGGDRSGYAAGIAALAIGTLLAVRAFHFVTAFHVFLCYASVISLYYAITYYRAFFVYVDPAAQDASPAATATNRPKLHVVYVVPVFNEQWFIGRCIASILASAEYANKLADVSVVVVNDASTDATAQRLQLFEHDPRVQVIHLDRNAGKKGALAAGMCGGVDWLDGYRRFRMSHGRNPASRRDDYRSWLASLREAGCEPLEADFYFHTDSDSIISEHFISDIVRAFRSDPQIAAVSGHCDVCAQPDVADTFWTRLQMLWYTGQFRIRKAAESPYVYCVSGPGAAFRADAIIPHLPNWVFDEFVGRIYRGATDRRITLSILQDGWKVAYSHRARVWTVVPSTYAGVRDQWTRWKQNFWRMLLPVCRFAYRLPTWSALLAYSRLFITVLSPWVVLYHVAAAITGSVTACALYLAGIAAMGLLMALATVAVTPADRTERTHNFWYRPLLSVVSSLWGSMLTLVALHRTLRGKFAWRRPMEHAVRPDMPQTAADLVRSSDGRRIDPTGPDALQPAVQAAPIFLSDSTDER